MKLTIDSEKDRVILEVVTTDKGYEYFSFPIRNIHYWYPFNVNFYYGYSRAEEYLYLIKEQGYVGDNYYGADVLKRTKPLSERNGVMFHPQVYNRNRHIIERARRVGIPTIKDHFDITTVETGFSDLGVLIHTIKNRIEDRILCSGEEAPIHESFSEEWDKVVYENMTEEEEEALIEFGEMYTMLTVMRKLAERG